jgi:hypothetical protein
MASRASYEVSIIPIRCRLYRPHQFVKKVILSVDMVGAELPTSIAHVHNIVGGEKACPCAGITL